LSPERLRPHVQSIGSPEFNALESGEQLAVFRLLKDQGKISEEKLDRVMTQWLLQLAQRSSD
jgi:hypothetical protein